MEFKTELHAHTNEVSRCALINAKEVADVYINAGYRTVVLTNHYTNSGFDSTLPWEENIKRYLDPIREMQAYAGDRLTVLPGAEVRVHKNSNDYLILGVDEDFFLEYRYLFRLELRTLARMIHDHGGLLIQAHPFRNGMTIVKEELLDGYEVFNGASSHHSRNHFANAWAKEHHKIRTSGTDLHYATTPKGGILTELPITSPKQLVETLRSGDYSLICTGSAAERDGMQTMSAKE